MTGTYVRDALGADLFAASGASYVSGSAPTLGSAATSTAPIHDLHYPGWFAVSLVTGTVTGTTPTLDVNLEASDSATFADTTALPTVSLGRFERFGDEDNATKHMRFYTNKRYVRAQVITGGTTPVFTGTTAKVVPVHDHVSKSTTA
jgi:hypothetical protein